MTHNRNTIIHRARQGFTILELLIVIVIVAIITSIVYATFSSVLASTETVNIAAEKLYTQSFLTRHIQTNASQAHSGWQPGAVYRPVSDPQNTITQVMPESLFMFQGVDNDRGDSITFTSSAPISGMSGLPGFLKQVTYEIVDGEDIDFSENSPYAATIPSGPVLRIREVPLMSYGDSIGGQVLSQYVDKLYENAESLGVAVPTWTFPVGGMDILYFDGEEWVDEWDMVEQERLPWALDFTFEWRPWGQEVLASATDNPENQFRMVVTIPGGTGIRNAAPAYGRPVNSRSNSVTSSTSTPDKK